MKSALWVWFHPSKAAGMLTELEIQLEEAVAETTRSEDIFNELTARAEALEQENKHLTEQTAVLTQRTEQTEKLLEQREAELKEERELAESWSDMDERMAEIERVLAGAEDMKRHYEDRISRLRAKIIELNEQLKRRTMPVDKEAEAEPPVIDMTPVSPLADDDPDADWLRPLP